MVFGREHASLRPPRMTIAHVGKLSCLAVALALAVRGIHILSPAVFFDVVMLSLAFLIFLTGIWWLLLRISHQVTKSSQSQYLFAFALVHNVDLLEAQRLAEAFLENPTAFGCFASERFAKPMPEVPATVRSLFGRWTRIESTSGDLVLDQQLVRECRASGFLVLGECAGAFWPVIDVVTERVAETESEAVSNRSVEIDWCASIWHYIVLDVLLRAIEQVSSETDIARIWYDLQRDPVGFRVEAEDMSRTHGR